MEYGRTHIVGCWETLNDVLYLTLHGRADSFFFGAMAITFRQWLREPLEWKKNTSQEKMKHGDTLLVNHSILLISMVCGKVLTKFKHREWIRCEVIDEPKTIARNQLKVIFFADESSSATIIVCVFPWSANYQRNKHKQIGMCIGRARGREKIPQFSEEIFIGDITIINCSGTNSNPYQISLYESRFQSLASTGPSIAFTLALQQNCSSDPKLLFQSLALFALFNCKKSISRVLSVMFSSQISTFCRFIWRKLKVSRRNLAKHELFYSSFKSTFPCFTLMQFSYRTCFIHFQSNK